MALKAPKIMTTQDVSQSVPAVSEDVTPQTQDTPKPEVTEEPATPGSQTPSENLLKALQEEREERKRDREKLAELEDKLNQYNTSVPSDNDGSDEGRVLKGQIDELKNTVSTLQSASQKSDALNKHPEMKDHWNDFESFQADPENKGMNFNTALKAFRVEKGLLEPTRQGLEDSTGGPRVPQPSGMTADEVKSLRETNPRKYRDMLKKGQMKIAA